MGEEAKYPVLTHEELETLLRQLRMVFDIVRTVDASEQKEVVYDSYGCHINKEKNCFDSWNKDGRCKNCISAMAYRSKQRMSKFEFVGKEIFHVITQYMEVDGQPCLLEIVEKDTDYTLSGAFGKDRFVKQIQEYSEQVYTDSLTGISNRRYYDDQIAALDASAVVMIDVDHFKEVNDVYGHVCGDQVLVALAERLKRHVRRSDSLIRYGGDEFLIAYLNLDRQDLVRKLENLRQDMERIELKEYPDLKITVSIGAVYRQDMVKRLMTEADEALYESKETRNCVTIR